MRNRKAFTLIELMIVIAIIAIIAAIAIPGILSARKSANSNAAFGNLKSFATAMTAFQNDDAQQKYPVAAINFGKYFSQPNNNTKNGYMYYYIASADQSQFIYIAFPVNINNGRKCYIVDESNRIWEGDSGDDNKAPKTTTKIQPVDGDITWTAEGNARIAWANDPAGGTITWTQKS